MYPISRILTAAFCNGDVTFFGDVYSERLGRKRSFILFYGVWGPFDRIVFIDRNYAFTKKMEKHSLEIGGSP